MENKYSIRIAFALVILSLLLGLAAGAAMIGLLSSFSGLDQSNISLISMAISTVFIAVPVLLYLRYRQIPLIPALRLNTISFKTLIAVILISTGFIVIVDELDRILYIFFGQPEYLNELAEQLKITSLSNGLILIITTIFVAPFIEEILFRGYFQKVLEDSWQDVTKAVLVTGLFFALVHLNPYWVIQIYLLGVALGYLAWRTNSILPGLILHGLNNGLAVALNNVQGVLNRYYNWHNQVNPIWVIFAIIFIILGFKTLNRDLENQS